MKEYRLNFDVKPVHTDPNNATYVQLMDQKHEGSFMNRIKWTVKIRAIPFKQQIYEKYICSILSYT